MQVDLVYAQRTSFVTDLNSASMSLAANLNRELVSFRGVVKEPVLMRQLMTALHRVIIDDARVDNSWRWVLDPVITVHPDQIFFEAFSTDESSYARLTASRDAFEQIGDVSFGTTNIDFTWRLRDALQNMRSSRRTTFEVGAAGFGVETTINTAGSGHFEKKVDLPETWLKGFLQVQGALTMHPYVLTVRPVDLLSIIHYLMDNRAKRPPNGMRYIFTPDEPVQVILEPWEEAFTLKGTLYTGYERTVRLWGRKRLELLLGILPYADRVKIGVVGRGLPHFYQCYCKDYIFTLVLSGWVRNDWASGSAFDLLAPPALPDPDLIAIVYQNLVNNLSATRDTIGVETMFPPNDVEHALFELARAGRVMVDPTTGYYRLRELFAEPLDTSDLFGGGEKIRAAQQLLANQQVILNDILEPEDNARRNEWRTEGTVEAGGEHYQTVAAVDTDGRLRFGQCTCAFFREHIMNRGPCEHILATRLALDEHIKQVSVRKVNQDIMQ